MDVISAERAQPGETVACAPPDASLRDLRTLLAPRKRPVRLEPQGFDARAVEWGEPWVFETAAYWVERAREDAAEGRESEAYCLGDSLEEELVACILGGYGVTYELNVAAFAAVRDAGLVEAKVPDLDGLVTTLTRPLRLASGRTARYRFPNQKAKRIEAALLRIRREAAPADPLAVRDWLLSFDGVGPKTASWVVRNRWPNAEVAIIDIHVWRAAVECGVFEPEWTPAKNYWEMEAVFIEWAKYGRVSAAALDVTIWAERSARARRGVGTIA